MACHFQQILFLNSFRATERFPFQIVGVDIVKAIIKLTATAVSYTAVSFFVFILRIFQ